MASQHPPPFPGPQPMAPGPLPFSGPPGFTMGGPPPQGFPFRPGMPPPSSFPPGIIPGMPPPMLRPPPQYSAPVPLPRPAAGTAAPRPGLPPQKETTVWVGKIASTVDDSLVRSLLEACGTIRSWKPMKDPESGKPKGFGFCEFEDAEGVLRAIRLLNHLPLDSQEILLKCNTATQKYVDDYAARKEAEAMQRKARRSAEAALSEKMAKEGDTQVADGDKPASQDGSSEAAKHAAEDDSGDDDDAFDSRVLELIMGLVSQRDGAERKAGSSAEAATNQLLSELPGPPPGRPSHRNKSLEQEERRAEQEFEDRRKRERQEAERERRRAEEKYVAALRKLEHWERDRRVEAEKEHEREKDVAKERLRSVRAEAEAVDDTGEEPWRRPLYTGSRQQEERKRRREKEEKDDAADSEAEAAAKAAAAAARAEPIPDDIADGLLTNGLPSPPQEQPPKAHVDPNDPIYQAMMAAAKAQPTQGTPDLRATPPQASPSPLRSPAAQPAGPQPARAGAPPAKKAKLLSAFRADEEEDQPKRRLIPLQYSEEEIRAAQAPAAAEEEELQPAPKSREATEKALKALIRSIPSDRAGIFAYSVNWSAYDSGRSAMAAKILGWVKMKVQELMGEEEASMVEFVMGQLNEHVPPSKLHEDLGPVLDDEVDSFVIKLYRMVIFETQKHAQGLQEVV